MAVARSFQGTVGSCTPSEPSTKSCWTHGQERPRFLPSGKHARDPAASPRKVEEPTMSVTVVRLMFNHGKRLRAPLVHARQWASSMFGKRPLPASATSLRFVWDGWAPNRRRQRHRRRCTCPRPPSWTRRDLHRSSPRNRGSSRAPLLQTRPRTRDLPTDLPRTNPFRFHGSESCHPSFFAFVSA